MIPTILNRPLSAGRACFTSPPGKHSNITMMNKKDRINTFEEFWLYYVREHSTAGCRMLHFIGSTLGVICLVSTFVTGNLWFIPLGLALGYGFAWFGHFFVEHNKPATFQYPLWSFLGDWKMWRMMLLGRMSEEIERIRRAA
jgi:hypothetical protein